MKKDKNTKTEMCQHAFIVTIKTYMLVN